MTLAAPTLIAINGKRPRVHDSAFVAPGAYLIGDVDVGPDASIWYNCVLRADINRIVIGSRSNLQDGTIVHVEADGPEPGGLPTLIGEDVLVGHMALLHGCVVESGAFVGMGAIVMDNCRIERRAMLAAGAMLTPGKCVPSGKLWAGRPAREMRELTENEFAQMAAQSGHYVENAKAHRKACAEANKGSGDEILRGRKGHANLI
ncbi:gamma carbonic anhydrase family protein [Aurantiacibacter poecillastricola]|uniref:gamma carbonic anhydrase family protein n=1 Tax=Aurantiacibacter poecillastricola TaxID=3064385 RepID=UPI00273EBEBF|nr:gamma carbonic anhydrase family protein [Aurantiacibacter sp. 219JJ12-13]MDP5263250.1 gamma carbonic anhydrase family protein [Aurantiacibacter sp. 219JJ12-13]